MAVTRPRTVYFVPVDAGQVIDGVAGIMADEQMFRQIFVNLFMNSLTASFRCLMVIPVNNSLPDDRNDYGSGLWILSLTGWIWSSITTDRSSPLPFKKVSGSSIIDIGLVVKFLKFPSKITNNSNGIHKIFQPQKLYGSANAAHLRLAVTCFIFVLSKRSPEFHILEQVTLSCWALKNRIVNNWVVWYKILFCLWNFGKGNLMLKKMMLGLAFLLVLTSIVSAGDSKEKIKLMDITPMS